MSKILSCTRATAVLRLRTVRLPSSNMINVAAYRYRSPLRVFNRLVPRPVDRSHGRCGNFHENFHCSS